ncbi:MAG: hypothetical protein ABEI75_05040 [Halobaculum sp.]
MSNGDRNGSDTDEPNACRRTTSRRAVLAGGVSLAAALAGCLGNEESTEAGTVVPQLAGTPTPTPSPTQSPTPRRTPSPTQSPTPDPAAFVMGGEPARFVSNAFGDWLIVEPVAFEEIYGSEWLESTFRLHNRGETAVGPVYLVIHTAAADTSEAATNVARVAEVPSGGVTRVTTQVTWSENVARVRIAVTEEPPE